jgi:hypothetical protein
MVRIEHYEFGQIVVDGEEERHDLIIQPRRVEEVVDDLPEHLVIVTGAHGRMQPDPHALGGAASLPVSGGGAGGA